MPRRKRGGKPRCWNKNEPMAKERPPASLFDVLREPQHSLKADEVVALFRQVDKPRVQALAEDLSKYITVNLPAAIERREELSDYRTNPYVLMTSATVMDLEDPRRFADFLFNTKLYMGLETSFGKSIEAAFVTPYPIDPD